MDTYNQLLKAIIAADHETVDQLCNVINVALHTEMLSVAVNQPSPNMAIITCILSKIGFNANNLTKFYKNTAINNDTKSKVTILMHKYGYIHQMPTNYYLSRVIFNIELFELLLFDFKQYVGYDIDTEGPSIIKTIDQNLYRGGDRSKAWKIFDRLVKIGFNPDNIELSLSLAQVSALKQVYNGNKKYVDIKSCNV